MRKRKNRANPLVWAIDPYESKTAHREPLAKAIRVFSHGLNQPVLPFSIISPGPLSWSAPLSLTMSHQLREGGERCVQKDLKKLHMKNIGSPEVEVRDSASRRELVDDVLRFAKENKAGIVAVNTRRLLRPLPRRLGGFAEALIGKSPLPVLAVSPKAKVSGKIRKILFPTDFSPASHRAFRKALLVSKRLKARIILLTVEQPLELPYNPPEMAVGLAEVYLLDAEKTRHKNYELSAKRWIKEAAAKGVKCTFVSQKGLISISKAILETSKRFKADLICMTGNRSPRTPALMGGTVRDVLCEAKTPVLEIHR